MQFRIWLISTISAVSPGGASRVTAQDAAHDVSYHGLRRAFTDIDDTMKCSHAAIFHGIDTNCDHSGELYPGVAQFQLELGYGLNSQTAGNGSLRLEPPSPVPLSARPRELRRFLRIQKHKPSYKYFKAVGWLNGLQSWSLDVEGAQYGSVRSARSMAVRDFEALLPRLKYEGWLNYNSSIPTVFVGDNGQGDVKAAMMMREHNVTADGRAPQLGAFIHHVQPVPLSSDSLETAWKSGIPGTEQVLADQNIFLFREYVHGACVAYKQGFITAEGYGRVASGVSRECSPQLPATSEHERLHALQLGDLRERTICRAIKPNFQVANGIWSPRSADDCEAPFRDPAPGLMDGIRPKDIVAAGGEYITGFCSDISASQLAGLSAAQELMDANGGENVGPTELAEAGLPEFLYWALKEGVHCLSDCSSGLVRGHSCNREHSDSYALIGSTWNLMDTGSRTWSGFCRRRTSHMCRLTVRGGFQAPGIE